MCKLLILIPYSSCSLQMMYFLVITLVVALCIFSLASVQGFQFTNNMVKSRITAKSKGLTMEYIPDGLSKAQWEAMKKKEQEDVKNKNLGAVGITKFKSRSFEAWQKSGGKNLFPVGKDVPLEARPYMQRQGGTPDGSDLKKKGLQPKDQATPFARSKIDEKYEKLEKEGKTKSTPFTLPWTSEAAAKITKDNVERIKAEKLAAAAAKGKPVKPAASSKKTAPAPVEEPKKKGGFFGLF